MSKKAVANTKLKNIPSVDEIIDYYKDQMVNAPYNYYLKVIRRTLDRIRKDILDDIVKDDIKKYTFNKIKIKISKISSSNLQRVNT